MTHNSITQNSIIQNSIIHTLGILISGRGSNMAAIIHAIEAGHLNAKIAVVISNNPQAEGLAVAKRHNIHTMVVEYGHFESARECESEMAKALQAQKVDVVILAGFMKLLKGPLLNSYPGKILNIHPSLLPAFKGLNAQKQAVDYGVRISGCSVHIVDETLDGGPILMQEAVPVLPEDTAETLSARILQAEHRLYPKAIADFLGRLPQTP